MKNALCMLGVFILMAIAVFGCSGCASSGVTVHPEQVAAFKVGVTTEQDCLKALGQPTSMATGPYGRLFVYSGSNVQMHAANFVPIVGLFAGGADVRSSSYTFRFKDGVLADMSSMQTGTGTENGVASRPAIPVRE